MSIRASNRICRDNFNSGHNLKKMVNTKISNKYMYPKKLMLITLNVSFQLYSIKNSLVHLLNEKQKFIP